MKHIKFFPCIFLFIFSTLSSQSILDQAAPLLIEDMISFQNSIYSIWNVGTCKEASLINHLESPSYLAGFGYTTKARIKKSDSKWAALSVNRYADDVGPDFVMLTYQNEEKFIVRDTLDGIYNFKDFCIFQDSLIAILNDSDEIFLYDFGGELVSELNTGLSLESIESYNNQVLGFSEVGFYLIDENGEQNGGVDLGEAIYAYFIENEMIHIGIEDVVETYDNSLNLVGSIPLEKDGELKEMLFLENDLYILSADEEQSTVYKIDENNSVEIIYKETAAALDFNRMISNNSSVYIYGHQIIDESVSINGIFEKVSSPSPSEKDISIDLKEIVQIPDTFDVHEQLDGSLVYEIYYYYDLQFSITNLSENTADDIFILSNRMHGVNCAYAQFQLKLKNINLEPGAEITIDTLYKAYRKYNELCLYAVSVDGEVDADFTNNSTCELVLSTDESATEYKVKLFPNPTNDMLTFEGIQGISQVRILDLSGKVIRNKMLRSQYTIDVSALSLGIYILEIVDQNKKIYIDKFVKL